MTSHAEIREKMAELMEELPEDVDDCGDYSRIYHGRAGIALKRSVEELYMNILAALEDFVRWYMQGTLSTSIWYTSTEFAAHHTQDMSGTAC